MNDGWPQSDEALVSAHCHFGADLVRGQADVTDFKRRARWHQAVWRETHGLPIGHHVSGTERLERLNGSRVELEHAQATGCNFLSDRIVEAVRHRLAHPERHQMLTTDRLWSDLLSSMPMCFNLFGELHADHERLTAATDALWPDHPGHAQEVRFEWSPGRQDRNYLSNRTAFDAAVILDLAEGRRGVIGIETKYQEHIRRERTPHEDKRLPRYSEVTERSKMFRPGWEVELIGTDLQQIWLDHLLALSMLQHPSGDWTWCRFVVVYPAANPSVARAVARYAETLQDGSTFEARTIEELLDARCLQSPTTEARFRARYLWSA